MPCSTLSSSPISRKMASSAPPSVSKRERMRKQMLLQLNLPDSQRLCMSAPAYLQGRIQESRDLYKQNAIIVSFRDQDVPQLSPLYNPNSDSGYISQCFDSLEVLGEGSFGRAVSARSKDDGKYYGVKFTLGPSPSLRIRDLRMSEIRKHETIPFHPNLVQLLCAWEEKGHFFLQMELCTKKGLDVLCNTVPRRYISEEKIWSYFIDIVLAVSHLHRNNLIHCDIKPANAFVTEDDICKLGDFGLLFNEKTDVRDADMDEGDGKYLAYEAFETGPTKAGDIFSLGITLLDLSCSKILPSSCDRFWIQDGRVVDSFLEGISSDRVKLIHAMTSKNPDMRPSAIDILMMDCVQSRMNERQMGVFNQYEANSVKSHSNTASMQCKDVYVN